MAAPPIRDGWRPNVPSGQIPRSASSLSRRHTTPERHDDVHLQTDQLSGKVTKRSIRPSANRYSIATL